MATARGNEMPSKQSSVEEKFDEIQQLVIVGKDRGYILFDEINDLLPPEAASAEELDELFSTLANIGIEVVESEDKYKEKKLLDGTSDENEAVHEIAPSVIDKTSDPVRMYLREMGTVPLLTREGEVEIAKRIERGQLTVLKIISRTPLTVSNIIDFGNELKSGIRTIRELVVLKEEELTAARMAAKGRALLKQIEAVRKARVDTNKIESKLDNISKRDKRRHLVHGHHSTKIARTGQCLRFTHQFTYQCRRGALG